MEIKDDVHIVGTFQFGILRGTDTKQILSRWWEPRKRWMFQKAYREAHRAGFEDILAFWREFGAVQMDGWSSSNRVVDTGLHLITNVLIAGGAALPTKIQLGRSGAAQVRSMQTLTTPIADGHGLDEASATMSAQPSGDTITVGGVPQNDILQGAHTFITDSATAYAGGVGVLEAGLRSTTPKLYCRTTFTEKALTAINDQLVSTYQSKLVP